MFSLLHLNLEHDIIKENKVVMGLKQVVYIFNLYMHGIFWVELHCLIVWLLFLHIWQLGKNIFFFF